MNLEIIGEKEFRISFCKWMQKNCRFFWLPKGETIEDYAPLYRMPDFDYVHTQSMGDVDGNLTTLLRSKYHLHDWQTKSGKEPADFEFYRILKTYTDRVEDGPVDIGYVIID